MIPLQNPPAMLAGILLHVLLVTAIQYDPILPPSYPLAVRNPYLSTWIPGNLVANLPSSSPQFWNGNDLIWSVIARVDGTAYSLLGVTDSVSNVQAAEVLSAKYTSTHSTFTLQAGSVTFTLDFLSPVAPWDYVRQSLPFSYLTVTVAGATSQTIQIYSDIDDSWTGQSSGTAVNFTTTGTTSLYSVSLADPPLYTESDDQALWGDVIYASRPSSTSVLSTQFGNATSVRSQFAANGSLTDSQDTAWTPGDVVAFAHDLGNVEGNQSVTFAVGYVREAAVNYLGDAYTGYYRAQYPDTPSAVSHFLDDYADAEAEAAALDETISSKATAVAGSNYSDIVELSVRQAYGAIDLTIPNDTLDTSDPFAFIKEISSDGNVNTIDIITPAFPIYYLLDPDWIKFLLEPVLKYLATGGWQQPYMIHDIGSSYPNATGHNDQQAEAMPIEESGNILILVYAYQVATGDSTWATEYTSILQKYADYLVNNSINIADQLSANDAAGPLPNQTGLAAKAAVGLKAFGELTGLTNYSDVGEAHANLLYNEGLGTDPEKTHFTLEYPTYPTTWKIPYNNYPDVLFDFGLFPQASYNMSSAFFPTVRAQYGVPLQNGLGWAKSDWNTWTAATLDTSTRDQFVDDLWAFITNGLNTWPFSDRYYATSEFGDEAGVAVVCRARPTVGGHLALLALTEGAGALAVSSSGSRKRSVSRAGMSIDSEEL
ncbi:hypothetical protein VTN77DRAFT_6602 [Rasamsonia byssochlamydoides]|uniref:uncharacterized protein n=1 Tax=Rasamsonia byssochlamydoides TaxID=89139 RepID=UPI0037438009